MSSFDYSIKKSLQQLLPKKSVISDSFHSVKPHNISDLLVSSNSYIPLSTLWLGGILLLIGIIIWIITSYFNSTKNDIKND